MRRIPRSDRTPLVNVRRVKRDPAACRREALADVPCEVAGFANVLAVAGRSLSREPAESPQVCLRDIGDGTFLIPPGPVTAGVRFSVV